MSKANDKPVFVAKQGKYFFGDPDLLKKLKELLASKGVIGWNRWLYRNTSRLENPAAPGHTLDGIDLSGLKLDGIDFRHVSLHQASFSNSSLIGARFPGINMWQIRFENADLRRADFTGADLSYASLTKAKLQQGRIVNANLTSANLTGARLMGANLSYSNLSGADLSDANLTGAIVTGTNTWGIETDASTIQLNLAIEQWIEPLMEISNDTNAKRDSIVLRTNDIEMAQLLYLLTRRNPKGKSEKLKNVLDAVTDRMVLILGNFGLQRKTVLTEIRKKLGDKGYVPVIFDFEPPKDRDLIETVAVLAGLSRFVIADFTSPSSTPLEALLIISGFKVPFAPIVLEGKSVFAMFNSLKAKYNWVLPTWYYKNKKRRCAIWKRT